MRSTDERIAAVHARSRTLRRRTAQRRGLVISGISAVACGAAIFGFAFYLPGVIDGAPSVSLDSSGAFGSIVASGGMLGFVIIGILSFILGVLLTLLCVKLRERVRDEAADAFAADGSAALFKAEETSFSTDGDDLL